MADVKRLHYFNHQFLVEADFTDEQQYHLTMRRRHNEALHTYGVADGLAVEKTGDKEVTVQPGMAIDREGRELVLLDPRVVSLSQGGGSTVYITIAYHEEESDPSTATGVTGNTRITEKPEVQAVTTTPPGDGSVIRLAQFVLDGAGNVPGNNGDTFTQGRQVAGALLADGAVSEAKLANSAVTTAKIADNTIAENKLDTATQGKLVTNGNNHDHSGGDGAQISHSSLNLNDGTNPHGTTAVDVGALPNTGGIVSGSLQVNGSIGVGVAPQPGDKLWLIANDGAAGTVVTTVGTASSDGSGNVAGLAVNAYGSGTGWKQGITSSVSGAGPKRAGQFSAFSAAGSDDYTSALYTYANSEGTGTVSGLEVYSSGSGTGQKQGIICNVSGAGSKLAGQFYASSAAGSTDDTTALSASASSDGTGTVTGLQISSAGAGTGWKQGVICDVSGAGPKRAGQFGATSAAGSSDFTNGLYTYADSEGSGAAFGLLAYAYGSGTGTKYGVYGYAGGGGTSYAGYFVGNVYVSGTLSKASGTFLIDHPLDPENKTLRHSFVESPEDLCLYRGKAKLDSKGQATVKMPDYFAALTKEDEATVSLTPIGSKPFLTGYEWNQSFTAFTIYGEAGREVSYLVLANRDDPVIQQLRRPVEEKKGKGYFEKGQLLNPEAFGKAPETAFAFRGVGPAGALTEGAEAPMAPVAFAPVKEESKRMEETMAKAREEQQQRMEAFRQEEEQRRKRLEETLAAIQPQPDRPSE